MIQLGIIDWGIWLFFVLVFGFFVYLYQSTSRFDGSQYLLKGFLLKAFGGMCFALIYVYYYDGGDTSEYFHSASQLNDVLLKRPSAYFDLLSMSPEEAQPKLRSVHAVIFYSHTSEEWFMVKLVSPLILLGFNSYLGVTFLMSFLSFIGSFKLFQLMNKLLPDRQRMVFRINFLIPTSLFWTSGLLKDTITFFCFALICSYFYSLLYERGNRLLYIIVAPVLIFVTLKLKAYIIISFMPWVLVTLLFYATSAIKNRLVKVILGPTVIVIILLSGYFGISYLIQTNEEYNAENLFSKIRGFHTWHTQLGGSAYNLGDMEYTETGLLQKVPAAINVSLFRPYPWESGSALVLLNSLESMCMLLLVVYVFLRTRLRFFSEIWKQPYLVGAFFFCLFFAFSIGITSYNFGALSRFKVPLTAIFVFLMVYTLYRRQKPATKTLPEES
jgi:hypothetical protein